MHHFFIVGHIEDFIIGVLTTIFSHYIIKWLDDTSDNSNNKSK
ncbi:MAG: hypothetical protein Q3988_05335 [Gemella sp.]|nr:hypothetical protein [Gemella sp.]